MGKLFDICHECQQHNSELKPLEAIFLSITDDLQFLWLKYQISMYLENRLKTIEKKLKKQKIFIFNQISIKNIKINVHNVMEQVYKVFHYA